MSGDLCEYAKFPIAIPQEVSPVSKDLVLYMDDDLADSYVYSSYSIIFLATPPTYKDSNTVTKFQIVKFDFLGEDRETATLRMQSSSS